MSTIHQACYGSMLPDPTQARNERKNRTSVFSLEYLTPPGMFRDKPQVRFNADNWERCLACPEFDHCYKLSMARLAMETAVANA